MHKSLFAAVFALAAGPFAALPAWSQAPAAHPLDFVESLRSALGISPELRRDQLNGDVASYDIVRARSAFLPRLDVLSTDDQIRLEGGPASLEALELSGRTKGSYSTSSVKLSLNVFNGGQDTARLSHAVEKNHEASLQVQQRRAAVARKVLDRFHAVRQAQFDLKSAQAELARARATFGGVAALHASGRAPDLKLAEADFDVKAKQLAVSSKQRTLRGALQDLSELTDRAGADVPPVVDEAMLPSDYEAVLGQFGFAPDRVVTSVNVYESRLRQATTDLPKAKGRFAPSLDVYIREDYAGVSTKGYRDAFDQQAKSKRFIGFSLTWNFFEGFDAYADVKQSALRIQSAQAELDVAREEQARSERDDQRAFSQAEEELQIERERLGLVEQRLKIDRLRVQLGKAGDEVRMNTESDYELQALEVRRREESLSYLKAARILKGASA